MKSVIMPCLVLALIGCEPKKKDGDPSDSSSQQTDGANDGTDGGTDSSGGKVGTVAITATVDAKYSTAVPISISGTDISGAGNSKAVSINGGQLALDVGKGNSLTEGSTSTVIMVMEGDGSDRLAAFDSMKFVSAPTEGEDSLVGLATSDAKVESIDLGAITESENNEDLVGDKVVGTDQFDLPKEEIKEMATVDDAMRTVKNSYANHATDGSSVFSAQEFYFYGDLAEARGAISNPASMTFKGWSPQLQITHPDFTWETLCDATASTFRLFEFTLPKASPRCSDDKCTTTDTIAKLTNAGAKPNETPAGNDRRDCGAGGSYIAVSNTAPHGVFMNFGSGQGFQGEIPQGTWVLEMQDGTQKKLIGKFDLAVSYPMIKDPADAGKEVPRIYIPAVELVQESSGKITKANIWFYLYDKDAKQFKKVVDYTTMKKSVDGLTYNMGARVNNAFVEAFSMPQVTYPANGMPIVVDFAGAKGDWRSQEGDNSCDAAPSGYYRAESFGIDYNVYGNRYKFTLKVPHCGE